MKKIFILLVLTLGIFSPQPISAQELCTCPKCNGQGMCDEDFARPCKFCTGGYNICNTCHGDGKEACYRCNETGIVQMPCSNCYGKGKINDETCSVCGGSGTVNQTCLNCSGKGWLKCHSCGGEGRFVCNMCGGKGEKVWRNTCPKCNGSGKIYCE